MDEEAVVEDEKEGEVKNPDGGQNDLTASDDKQTV